MQTTRERESGEEQMTITLTADGKQTSATGIKPQNACQTAAIPTLNEVTVQNRFLCHLVQHLIKKKSACVISLESAGVFVYYRERMGFKICNSDDRLQFVEVKHPSTSKFFFGFPKIEQGT